MKTTLILVAKGVWQTPVASKTLPPYDHTHCYWIDTGQGFILIDTGDGVLGTQQLYEAYVALGKPPMQAVIMTHGHHDHVGGANWAYDQWRTPIWLNFKDWELLPEVLQSASYWQDLGTIRSKEFWGMELIDAPGHTPGQINLFLPKHRLLFAGDNLLGNSTSVITPPYGHLRTYLRTLDRLEQYDAQVVLPAHGDIITNPARYITLYRRHRAERLAQIQHALKAGPLSAQELAQELYPGNLQFLGERMMLSHLQYLVEEQEITLLEDGIRYRLTAP
ncbi:MBL fold metallo-hydrolase [Sulfobacillus thermosulfidooxidans]|uniref:MBL fold metallo-hydrolase n=1 Tax=Sulfobacillus thermosulfidooxidans TaxID=28034 RepID=UPI00041440E6|nr:MBL fold metallo-hydrolase [Sulfobacillus thermosulfidooxidans]